MRGALPAVLLPYKAKQSHSLPLRPRPVILRTLMQLRQRD